MRTSSSVGPVLGFLNWPTSLRWVVAEEETYPGPFLEAFLPAFGVVGMKAGTLHHFGRPIPGHAFP